MREANENQGSQVIIRAAQILRALENQPLGLSITALAKETGLPRTTVHRLVMSLESQQLLINGINGVQLGPALARLAASAHTDLVTLSRPAMEMLSRRTHETVNLSVYRGMHVVLVSQYASDQELRVISPLGTAFPCHSSAHGKALWASQPPASIDTFLKSGLDARTESTITHKQALLTELETVRNAGFAIDREEHARGVCAIGVVLNTHLSEQYALSVAVPALRFEEKYDSLLSMLMQCKAEIETLLDAAN